MKSTLSKTFSNSSTDKQLTKDRSTQDRSNNDRMETSSIEENNYALVNNYFNSAHTLTPTYTTPLRSPLTTSNPRSSEKRDKPFVLDKEFIACMIERENKYYPNMQ